ncbi:MAG: NAD-dependent epimerase/dehydratase family protein [Deltaproteobacteria bacterium]|nr:NAD-dependent epimerase/dehydratase family protein [Deltaproteobacteria bacterium]
MSVAVITGASGLLGGNLAAALLAAGHTVRATRRRSTKVDHLADLAIEWVDGDLGDAGALTAAFRGADVVFHAAAAVDVRKGVSAELTAGNVDGVRTVLSAFKAAGAKRLVHVSSVVAVGLSTDGRPVDETARWNFDLAGFADGYAITKRQGEELVRAATDLDAVIVNPTYMFGPRDVRPSSGRLIIDVARRKVPGWTPGYNNFVDVRDVARGMIAAWQKGARGERYILGGHDLTYRAIMETIAGVAGVKPPRLGIPHLAARAAGWWGDRAEARGKRTLVTSTTIRYAFTDRFRFSSAKAIRDLGYAPSPIEPAIADAVAWFRAHRML